MRNRFWILEEKEEKSLIVFFLSPLASSETILEFFGSKLHFKLLSVIVILMRWEKVKSWLPYLISSKTLLCIEWLNFLVLSSG